ERRRRIDGLVVVVAVGIAAAVGVASHHASLPSLPHPPPAGVPQQRRIYIRQSTSPPARHAIHGGRGLQPPPLAPRVRPLAGWRMT
ncbi:hypothetical protein COCCADRAFT_81881, partial [Bipolaris zeicola 26-R-13]